MAKIRKIKKKIQPVEGKLKGRKIKVKKDVFASDEKQVRAPVTTAGKEFQDEQDLVNRANKIASRKIKAPKPQSLTEQDGPNSLSEGDGGSLPLAPIDSRKIKLSSKKKKKSSKVKRKKK